MNTYSVTDTGRHNLTGVSGMHTVADLFGCADNRYMTDGSHLERACVTLVDGHGLTAVGQLFHRFPGDAGVTGTVILAESHLSIHTWPEHGYVSLDVFVCNYSADNTDKARALAQALADLFDPEYRRLREIER